MKTAVAKEVTVLARAQFKNNSKAVVYKVLSSNGKDEYYTTIYDGKAVSCTCPAKKPCYHMVQLQERENERKAATEPKGSLNGNREFSLMR